MRVKFFLKNSKLAPILLVSIFLLIGLLPIVKALHTIRQKPMLACFPTTPTLRHSPTLIAGIIAQEDHSFFENHGVDIYNLLQSSLQNLISGKIARGGSTITMQVATLCYHHGIKASQQSFFSAILQKTDEIFEALILTLKYKKSEILSLYLNIVPLIPSELAATGFAPASRVYFGKPIDQLTQEQEWALILALKNREHLNPKTLENLEQLSSEAQLSLLRSKERQKQLILKYNDRLTL